MEQEIIKESYAFTRAEAERRLRAYRKSSEILRASRRFFEGGSADADEAVIHAQMYSTRALILSVEDVREKMLLYHYYVKGLKLENCAKLLGISLRSVYRLKIRALDSVAQKLTESGGK